MKEEKYLKDSGKNEVERTDEKPPKKGATFWLIM
jgi:hypothetical protein